MPRCACDGGGAPPHLRHTPWRPHPVPRLAPPCSTLSRRIQSRAPSGSRALTRCSTASRGASTRASASRACAACQSAAAAWSTAATTCGATSASRASTAARAQSRPPPGLTSTSACGGARGGGGRLQPRAALAQQLGHRPLRGPHQPPLLAPTPFAPQVQRPDAVQCVPDVVRRGRVQRLDARCRRAHPAAGSRPRARVSAASACTANRCSPEPWAGGAPLFSRRCVLQRAQAAADNHQRVAARLRLRAARREPHPSKKNRHCFATARPADHPFHPLYHHWLLLRRPLLCAAPRLACTPLDSCKLPVSKAADYRDAGTTRASPRAQQPRAPAAVVASYMGSCLRALLGHLVVLLGVALRERGGRGRGA